MREYDNDSSSSQMEEEFDNIKLINNMVQKVTIKEEKEEEE